MGAWTESFSAVVRNTGRRVLRAPARTLGIIALFALGTAGVSTLFVPLRALVLSPLPFPESDRLVAVGTPILNLYTDTFPSRAELSELFSAVASYWPTRAVLSVDGRPTRVAVTKVTPEFFATLGVPLWRGPGFRDESTVEPVAIVAHGVWQRWLNGASDLSNASLVIDAVRFQVIGVAAPGFDFPSGTQIWVPIRSPAGGLSGGRPEQIVIGRLQSGVTLRHAVDRVRIIAQPARTRLQGMHQPAVPTLPLESLHTFLLGERRHLLWVLWTASVLFLLLACVGVGNLLWLAAVRRRPELATRSALGASRRRLVSEWVAEVLVLSAIGGLFGHWLSMVAIRLLALAFPMPAHAGGTVLASPANVVLLATMVVAATVLCGVPTGLYATRRRGAFNVPSMMLAGAQLALAMILLTSTALLLRSLTARFALSSTFQPEELIVVDTQLPPSDDLTLARRQFTERIRTDPRLGRVSGDGVTVILDDNEFTKTVGPAMSRLTTRNRAWYANTIDAVSAQPIVLSAALVSPPPFSRSGSPAAVRERYNSERWIPAVVRWIGPSALHVMSIPLVIGRQFGDDDRWSDRWSGISSTGVGSADAAIINKTLADRLWPGEHPIGKPIFYLSRRIVVGVVADVHESIESGDVQPTLYVPFPFDANNWTFVVRVKPGLDFRTVSSTLQRTLNDQIPAVEILSLKRLSDIVAEPLRNVRFATLLFACFAALAVAVAALGVYATAAELATSRRREIGIRMALGATPRQVQRWAIWQNMRVALLAVPIGAVGAWACAQGLGYWLFQVGPFDVVSFAESATLLLLTAFGAAYVPAIRSAATDPAVVLVAE